MANARFSSTVTNEGGPEGPPRSLTSTIIAGLVLTALGVLVVWLCFLVVASVS